MHRLAGGCFLLDFVTFGKEDDFCLMSLCMADLLVYKIDISSTI